MKLLILMVSTLFYRKQQREREREREREQNNSSHLQSTEKEKTLREEIANLQTELY